ncbi:MAG: NAD-dependent epimerase/dehydratase family protein [Flavobacteriaceae bacterium]|jgi:nucleoside-diphosphate-sugar epimerase
MKVLFIGGTGIISSASSELAIQNGIDLYHLNRGKSFRKIEGVKTIIADIRNFEAAKKTLENHEFDAVVDWISFTPEHIQNNIKLFTGKTKQFVFISSASIYQTPPEKLPVTEETPLHNPIWKYSQDKIACENILREAYSKTKFPYTIVRPSHTYDKTLIPITGSYTALHRMKQGLPVIVHGDGSSIWTLTHHKDFAVGLIGLLGKPEAINEAYHITNNELLSWNTIYKTMAKELGVTPNLVYIPSHIIAKYDKDIGDGLLGDKTHSMIFDNSKIKALVPEFNPQIFFNFGAKEIVSWYNKPENQLVNENFNNLTDIIIKDYENN